MVNFVMESKQCKPCLCQLLWVITRILIRKKSFLKGGRLTNRNINDNDMKVDENNLYQDNENLIIVYYNSQLFINLKGWDFKVESWFGSLTEASLHQLCEGAQPQPPRLLYVCRGIQQLAHVYSVYGQTGMLDWWWSINTSQHLDVYFILI